MLHLRDRHLDVIFDWAECDKNVKKPLPSGGDASSKYLFVFAFPPENPSREFQKSQNGQSDLPRDENPEHSHQSDMSVAQHPESALAAVDVEVAKGMTFSSSCAGNQQSISDRLQVVRVQKAS